MKRYFEVIGQRLTLQIDVTKEGQVLTIEQLNKHFKSNLREVNRKEYNRLGKEFEVKEAQK